ncbi:DUF494 family protein [Neisseria sp. Ec49-e6-T10]|uniref:DUF494 family protein n=1 Tax=Neisseria sp. Ec49-e6-T10 TaxID=3140744 RepID=UPI003EBAC3EE
MFDVFVFLMEHFQDLDSCPQRESLNGELKQAGFEQQEIQQALDWMDKISSILTTPNKNLLSSEGFRVFSDQEFALLPQEILGLLSFLSKESIIDGCQRELIIEALLDYSPLEVDVQHTKMLVLIILWAYKAELPILIGDDLLSAIHGEPTKQ